MRHAPDFRRSLHDFRRTRRAPRARPPSIPFALALVGMLAAGAAIGIGWSPEPPRAIAAPSAGVSVRFGLCHSGGGTNCVVDGDTFWMDGIKIRIADIDAPETHPSRCAEEARLGGAATLRLQALLSAGPVTLVTQGRESDRYGRALRIAMRNGRSLGAQLVSEGLARPWTGRRQPWCLG